jgi:hypothetical protein
LREAASRRAELLKAGLQAGRAYTACKKQGAFGRNIMKFGIFYELQLPRPWVEGGELKLYQNALTQLETADRSGYDYAWVVEHHFLEDPFSPRQASAQKTSGSATASSSSPPIIPRASPSVSLCSIF